MRARISQCAVAALLGGASVILSACGIYPQTTVARQSHPNVSAEGVNRLIDAIEGGRYGEVHSVLILIDGDLVLEAYFGGHERDERRALYSITKSFLSTLIGIAIDEGRIRSVREPVLGFFPEYPDITNLDARKRALTIQHLLTMTAGLQWNELSLPYDDPNNDYRRYLASSDRVKYALGLRMVHAPGTRFSYNTALSQILSVILSRATGMSAAEYAKVKLFEPLDILDWSWTAYDSEASVGGAGLYLRSVDIAKLGQLYLQNGVWDGRQVVPASWVQASTTSHVAIDRWQDYGYQWWCYSQRAAREHLGGHERVAYALGRGGQYLWVLPDAGVVVGCTAWNDNNGQWPEAMLWEHVIPLLAK